MVANVFCVVPVHNRVEITKRFLGFLSAQDYPALHVVVIDDGSTDGTADLLAQSSHLNLTVLRGDGTLWWGGALHMGMQWVSKMATDADYLLILNDDVRIERNYVSTLVRESVSLGGVVIGSAQHDEETGEVMDCGYHIDFWGMRFLPIENGGTEGRPVDALPTRGVLFPYVAVRHAGNVYSGLFPHYLVDLEYSSRVRERGWKLMVSRDAPVFTSPERSDEKIRARGWFMRRLSWRSRESLIQKLLFFSVRGPWPLRVVAMPRYFLVGGWRGLKSVLQKKTLGKPELGQ